MNTIRQRILSVSLSMLCALLVGGAFRVQAQDPPIIHLSDEDKSRIVESVLRGESMVSSEEFRGLTLSSENLEFLEPYQISTLRSILLNPETSRNSGSRASYDWGTGEYLIFRKIESSGNNAIVILSRVLERNPCFGPRTSRQQTFTYQYHIESGRWTGKLIRRRTPIVLGDITSRSRATGAMFRIRNAP
jgi:hypothetical protein